MGSTGTVVETDDSEQGDGLRGTDCDLGGVWENSTGGQAKYAMGAGMPRRVSVKASQGEHATVVVTVVHGTVWMSIRPLFTWEAIMTPAMVDEVVRVLKLARDEARGITESASGRQELGGDARIVREIGKDR